MMSPILDQFVIALATVVGVSAVWHILRGVTRGG